MGNVKLPQKHDEVPAYRAAVEADIAKDVAAHRSKHDLPYLLVQVRAQIVETDAQLVALLRRRAVLVEAATVAKGLAGIPVHDPEREATLVANMASTPGPVQDAYREVIRVCRQHAQRRNGEGEAAVSDPVDGGDPPNPA